MYYYSEEEGERPINWIEEYCTHVKGPLGGDRLILDEWQKEIIREAYGWKQKKNNDRRYQVVYVEIPRGNAKSTLGSALALYSLVGDRAKAAEVYCCAGSRDQATMVFTPSKVMVQQNEDLSNELKVLGNAVFDKEQYGVLKVISADAKFSLGQNPSAIFFDELLVQPNSKLYDALITGMSKRANLPNKETGEYSPYAQNSIMFIFTTAGERETFAHEMHEYALKVKAGVIKDDSFLPIIFGAPMDADPFDPKVWAAANPGWNFINQRAFEQMANRAKNQPGFLNTFKQFHLNQWVGTSEAWLSPHEWEMGNKELVDIKELKGRKCYGGLDLARVRDLCSFSLFFPKVKQMKNEDNEMIWVDYLYWWFWCPEAAAYRDNSYSIDYSKWVASDLIIATPGTSTDYNMIEKFIIDLSKKYDIVELSYDPQFAHQMATNFDKNRININVHRQQYKDYSESMNYLESSILEGRINHGGNPVMNWQISNVQIQVNESEGRKPTKKHSKGKIDGVAACLMAISSYLDNTNKTRNSRYEEKGLTIL